MAKMKNRLKTVVILCGAWLLLGLSAGCPRSETSGKNPSLPPPQLPTPKQEEGDLGKPSDSTQQALPAQPSVGQLVAESSLPNPLEIPRVVMAEIDRAKCKVFVGDTIPEFTLEDLDGQPAQWKQFLGQSGTVVAFLSAGQTSRERLLTTNLLADLQEEILQPYGTAGIAVIGIHVGAPGEPLTQIIKDARAQFPILVDREGKLAMELTSHSPPTLYLLDASGKIVWLDIEYSRSVRENLRRAVAALVQTKK